MLAAEMNDTISRPTDAFNANDLDRVMTFFSKDAVYEPGSGRTYRGKPGDPCSSRAAVQSCVWHHAVRRSMTTKRVSRRS